MTILECRRDVDLLVLTKGGLMEERRFEKYDEILVKSYTPNTDRDTDQAKIVLMDGSTASIQIEDVEVL